MHKIHGTYCAALTPLNTDYSINKELFLEHCSNLLSQGLDGLAIFGTTGEGNSFNVNEKIEAVNYLIDNNIGYVYTAISCFGIKSIDGNGIITFT